MQRSLAEIDAKARQSEASAKNGQPLGQRQSANAGKHSTAPSGAINEFIAHGLILLQLPFANFAAGVHARRAFVM